MANLNPLGMFGGNFLAAFTAAKQAKGRKEDEKTERDARLKLFEIQLKREQASALQAEEQATSRKKFFGLLGGPQEGTPGIDATQIAGAPGTNPVPAQQPRFSSVSQALADPEGFMLAVQGGVISGQDALQEQRLSQQQKWIQDAVGGFGGLQGPGMAPGQAQPGQQSGGMDISRIKLDAQGPSLEFQPRSQTQLDQMKLELERLKAQSERMGIGKAQRDAIEEITGKVKAKLSSETNLNRTLEHLREASELNQRLASTLLRSGTSLQQVRRAVVGGISEVRELFGVDTTEARKIIADYDRFNKLSSDLIIQSLDRISGEGAGRLTNDRLSLLRTAMGGVGTDPGANSLILADTIEALLDSSRIEGYTVDDGKQYAELAKQLRSPVPQETRAPLKPIIDKTKTAINKASDVARMSLEQLSKLDPAQMSEEALAAAAKRYEQLRKK